MANDQKVEILQAGTPVSASNALFVQAVSGGTFEASGVATAAAPSYSEGTVNPLSMSLAGALRTTGLGTAGTAAGGVTSVQGPTAAAATLAANPVTIGGRAATTNPTAVTDGQVVNAQYSKTGKAIAIGALRTMKSDQQTQISASTAETTIVAAGAAGVFNDLYGLILANTGATTTKVTIRDGTGGTVRAIIEVPTLETRGFMLPVDSGFSQATAAVVWTAQCGSSTAALEVTAMFAQNT